MGKPKWGKMCTHFIPYSVQRKVYNVHVVLWRIFCKRIKYWMNLGNMCWTRKIIICEAKGLCENCRTAMLVGLAFCAPCSTLDPGLDQNHDKNISRLTLQISATPAVIRWLGIFKLTQMKYQKIYQKCRREPNEQCMPFLFRKTHVMHIIEI